MSQAVSNMPFKVKRYNNMQNILVPRPSARMIFERNREKSRKHITFESIEEESNKQLIFIPYTLSEKRDIFEEKPKNKPAKLNLRGLCKYKLDKPFRISYPEPLLTCYEEEVKPKRPIDCNIKEIVKY